MICLAAMCLAPVIQAQPEQAWTHLAGTAPRLSIADTRPDPITSPTWILRTDDAGRSISMVPQAGVVANDTLVIGIGQIEDQYHAIAAHRTDGTIAWTHPVPSPVFDSWSTPAIDASRGTVLIASGTSLIAFDLSTGSVVWQTQLNRDIINASPLVTQDLAAADRAFITDADGLGFDGRLYCINVDPFNAASNPFEPGQIVWSVPLGALSGNTPCYKDGIIYITSPTDPDGASPGQIHAFDATTTAPPAPLWTFMNIINAGFFGGLCITQNTIYAASYAFDGGQFSANLVKLDATTGSLIWSVPSNRTSSIPIPLPDGRIVLSTGLQGFGSVPSIQLFQDNGDGAQLLWDSALDTWEDDGDGRMEPGEFLRLGGWTHQPAAVIQDRQPPLLYTGAIPDAGLFGPYTDLYAINLNRFPTDSDFIVEHVTQCGATPALADANIYTIGEQGLFAFGPPPPPPCNCDVNQDGRVDVDDLYAWEQSRGMRDVNGDGVIDQDDRTLLIQTLRANETADMAYGRRR